MNVDELIQIAGVRGWQTSLRVPGRTRQDGGDNLYVVDHDESGWFIGFLERGEMLVLRRCADEEEAATAAYHYLRRAYEGEPPAGLSGAPAAEPATNPSGEGWTTWTFGKHD
jgi:hypothetical protein